MQRELLVLDAVRQTPPTLYIYLPSGEASDGLNQGDVAPPRRNHNMSRLPHVVVNTVSTSRAGDHAPSCSTAAVVSRPWSAISFDGIRCLQRSLRDLRDLRGGEPILTCCDKLGVSAQMGASARPDKHGRDERADEREDAEALQR